jgi:hypothetical protein
MTNPQDDIFNIYKNMITESKDTMLPGVHLSGKKKDVDSKNAKLAPGGATENAKDVELNDKKKKLSENVEKIDASNINKNMSTKKTLFDKLFEDVMTTDQPDDLAALGVDSDVDSSADTDLTDDAGDTVTFTLDRATAQALVDVLTGALGEAGEEEVGEEEVGEEEDGEEEDGEDVAFEATEMEELSKDGKELMGKNNKVGDDNVKPVSGKADSGKVPAIDTGSAGPKHKQAPQKVGGKVSKPGTNFFKA